VEASPFTPGPELTDRPVPQPPVAEPVPADVLQGFGTIADPATAPVLDPLTDPSYASGSPFAMTPAPFVSGEPFQTVPAPQVDAPFQTVPAPQVDAPFQTVAAPPVDAPFQTVAAPQVDAPFQAVAAPPVDAPFQAVATPETMAAPAAAPPAPALHVVAPPAPPPPAAQAPAPAPAPAPGYGMSTSYATGLSEVTIPTVAEDEEPPPPPSLGRANPDADIAEDDISLADALSVMLDMGASDLHLTSGARPAVRIHGGLVALEDFPILAPTVIQRVMYAAITQIQRERFEETLELDFAYSLPGRSRFRVNMYRQRDAIGAAFRVIPYEIKELEALGIPPVVGNFASLPRGFVLVTGPTGSGKSTTLASLVDLANRTRFDHIMTVEDPIEFIHRHKSCLVNQREVGEDTKSFTSALKHVLRQDPDIILVGEMRDLETIQVALTAAETGHLVFATLHTQDAAQTIDRIIDVFPPHQQQQIRQQLAASLQGVVCQTLARTADGRGRAVATEVLVATSGVRNLIREGKTHQIYSAMQAGAQHGMHTMDQHLAELVRTGRIAYDTALEKCHHVEDFNRLCGKS